MTALAPIHLYVCPYQCAKSIFLSFRLTKILMKYCRQICEIEHGVHTYECCTECYLRVNTYKQGEGTSRKFLPICRLYGYSEIHTFSLIFICLFFFVRQFIKELCTFIFNSSASCFPNFDRSIPPQINSREYSKKGKVVPVLN
jgi:hypothetical protein